MIYHPTRVTWSCDDCARYPDLWRARGRCDGQPTSEIGCDGGRITAEASVGLDAAHLGEYERCPVAMILEHRPMVDRVMQAYSFLRRFGVRSDDDIPDGLLLAVDEEIRKIEAIERDDARKRAEIEQKARSQRR